MLTKEVRETLRLRYPRGGVAPTSDGLWSDLLDSLDEMDAALKAAREENARLKIALNSFVVSSMRSEAPSNGQMSAARAALGIR